MTKPINGIVGLDFTSAGGRTDDFAPNTEIQCDNGIWMRVISGTAIATGNVLHVAASGTANPITAALAVTTGRFGVAQYAAATGSSMMIQRTGNFQFLSVLGLAASGALLYTTDTAGVLDDTTASASHFQVMGVKLITTVGSTATAAPAQSQGYLLIRQPAA